jgi:hypothetical protein
MALARFAWISFVALTLVVGRSYVDTPPLGAVSGFPHHTCWVSGSKQKVEPPDGCPCSAHGCTLKTEQKEGSKQSVRAIRPPDVALPRQIWIVAKKTT